MGIKVALEKRGWLVGKAEERTNPFEEPCRPRNGRSDDRRKCEGEDREGQDYVGLLIRRNCPLTSAPVTSQ